jgi:plastocyanin
MTKLLGIFGIMFCALALACGGSSGNEPASRASVTPEPANTVAASNAPSATAASAATQAGIPIQPSPTSTPEPQPTAAPAPTQAPAPPTTAPAPTTAPPPVSSGPVTIAVSAQNLAFDKKTISVPANAQVTVNFTNNDLSVTHDFGVSIPFVPHTETCAGPCNKSIVFDSGAPATYTFQCSIHQDMVGTFTVQ